MICTQEVQVFLEIQTCAPLRRDSATLVQRSYRGSLTGSIKLRIPNFPSRVKRWGFLSCCKPQEVELLCQNIILYDGELTPSFSDPGGGLDGEAEIERCLLACANPPRSASPPPVLVAKENVLVYII